MTNGSGLGTRIVVTGAEGFIGQRLVRHLKSGGADVARWSRRTVDLLNREDVAREMTALCPSQVYHLAASDASRTDADWNVPAGEVEMLQNLASALPAGARMVHCGSMAEFGYSGVLGEDDARRPHSVYGFAKACASDRAVALAESGDCDVRVARLFGVYGPGEGPGRLLPQLVNGLMANRPVPLGLETRCRDFVHVDDVCSVLTTLMGLERSAAFPVVNVGTGQGVTVGEVCRKVVEWLAVNPALLRFGEVASRPVDENVLVANVERLARSMPVPRQHWRDGGGLARDYTLLLAAQHSERQREAGQGSARSRGERAWGESPPVVWGID